MPICSYFPNIYHNRVKSVWLVLFSLIFAVDYGLSQSLKLENLSQSSNLFITRSSNSQKMFISSLNGLNIYNGRRSHFLSEDNSNLKDGLLQGPLFEDNQGKLWFATYEALNVYIDSLNDFNVFQFKDAGNSLIESDYWLMGQTSDDNLILQAGPLVLLIDITSGKVFKTFPIDLSEYDFIKAIDTNDEINIAACGKNQLLWIKITSDSIAQQTYNQPAFSSSFLNDRLFVGMINGEIQVYRRNDQTLLSEHKIGDSPILDIKRYGAKLLVTTSEEILLTSDDFSDPIEFLDLKESLDSKPFTLGLPYIDADSMLWIGLIGKGVQSYDLKTKKFGLLRNEAQEVIQSNITEIVKKDSFNLFLFTFNDGIYKHDSRTKELFHWVEDLVPGEHINGSLYGDQLLFEHRSDILSLNTKDNSISRIFSFDEKIIQAHLLDSFLYFTTESTQLHRLVLSSHNAHYELALDISTLSDCQKLLYFAFDGKNNLFISCGDKYLLILDDTFNLVDKLNIKGGLLDLKTYRDSIYIANFSGLYQINARTFDYKKVRDHDNIIKPPVYGILFDKNDDMWLSSNNGILRYDVSTNRAHSFKLRDGLQGKEYNRMSFLKDSENRFLFGGVNGVNVFDPLKVKLSTKDAPIDFYNYKINDEDSREFGVANYVPQFDLYHYNNTITFEFVGIDYTGPEHVNLKYYMEGHDPDWVELEENNGVARYANLPYGEYTFHMLASNSDEVWSKTGKCVPVIVHPPFWVTWWFRTIAGLGILAIGYFIVRGYYRRKLEKRDFILRQQELKIEKQQAIEYERNRIASEMHDDLGSGLTTIKYLSEHAIKASKKEKGNNDIKRIADHANKLVSNMSEIIWAMNSRYDTASDLTGYIRHYASEFLEEHSKTITFSSKGISHKIEISGEKRRNIFLVTKEILHNFIKYALVDEMQINVILEDNNLSLAFLEVGNHSFDNKTAHEKGNGLFNMTKRMTDIGGTITRMTTAEGLRTTLHYSLKPRT